MKRSLKILFLVICLFSFCNVVNAVSEKNLVNIYLFHSYTCKHCKEEIKLLDELEKEYDNIKVYKYEVNENENGELLKNISEIMGSKVTGTPYTIIGNKVFSGYDYENSKGRFKGAIEYYSKYGYEDKVGEYISSIPLPSYEVKDTDPDVDEYISNYISYKVKLPLIGEVKLKNLTLPLITVVIGLADGFNPCAMWVLLFLISMLIGMKDKKRMWILGSTFLLISALIYLIFMMSWLNLANLLISVVWVRVIIAVVSLVGGFINLRGYIKHRKVSGCDVVDDKKRNRIITRIKKFTTEKNFWLAILGVIVLAISVNVVELACSAGLPVMFIEILSLNNLTAIEEIIYIVLYMLFFLLDDFVVFVIAMTTLSLTGVSSKYGNLSKLIGGILMLFIGLLLMFKPEWIMFNF
ncbi:MAG: thioredoxin family protein [Bacilli bacterium]|nr:thioredoxin family protein [Bacilli bacterium]